MLSAPSRSILFVAFMSALLPSCSSGSTRDADSSTEAATEFTQDDKRAARALSLTNAGTTERTDDPQEQARLCSSAIEALRVRLRDSAVLSDEQMLALGEAKAIYDRRIRGVVASASEAANDQPEQAEGDASPAEQARLAIGCLQDLQNL